MTDPFRPAQREQAKARILLHGPAGSGKTFTALTLATNLADRVAVVDTEHGRALEYRDRFEFNHTAPVRFDPRDLVALLAAAGTHGYGAVVIDSLSHYWMGAGGALEFVDSRENARGGKFSAGWKEYRPIENAMWAALLAYPGHVIATMRVKTAYEIERDERGKPVPRKVGLKPEQREGSDYEFSIVGEMDLSHSLTVTKSTCPDLSDAVVSQPGPEVAATIAAWCSGGEAVPDARDLRERALKADATYADLRAVHTEARQRRLLGAVLLNEHGDPEPLGELIVRLGNERKTT